MAAKLKLNFGVWVTLMIMNDKKYHARMRKPGIVAGPFHFGFVVFAFLLSTSVGNADSTSAWIHCFTSEKWCVLTETDQITKKQSKNVFVTGKKPIFVHQAARVDLLLMCRGLEPWAYIETGASVAYRELRIRYRVDPSGKIGNAVASHVRSGNLFEMQDSSFLDDIRGKTKLTAEFTDGLDGSGSTTAFDIEGTDAMIRRMGCGGAN